MGYADDRQQADPSHWGA